ncbi:MAG: TIM barrel protein [Kiritimatiellia bacterium]
MDFSLSTSYFARQELSPKQMAKVVRELGFTAVELGYFVCEMELDEWEKALAAESLTVSSVHAFCPMSLEMPQLGPEIFSLAAQEEWERQAACKALLRTLACAVRFSAHAVVIHGGRVELREPRRFLLGSKYYHSRLEAAYCSCPETLDEALIAYEQGLRKKQATVCKDALIRSLTEILPHFESQGIALAFENLPGIEAFPDPVELLDLRKQFPLSCLSAWYDIGHGERKQRVGDWSIAETLRLTEAMTVGVHIHDVSGLRQDHCAPGEGSIDFKALVPLLSKPNLLRVFEPAPSVTREALRKGLLQIQRMLA